mgnify:CR=1 FL=1
MGDKGSTNNNIQLMNSEDRLVFNQQMEKVPTQVEVTQVQQVYIFREAHRNDGALIGRLSKARQTYAF